LATTSFFWCLLTDTKVTSGGPWCSLAPDHSALKLFSLPFCSPPYGVTQPNLNWELAPNFLILFPLFLFCIPPLFLAGVRPGCGLLCVVPVSAFLDQVRAVDTPPNPRILLPGAPAIFLQGCSFKISFQLLLRGLFESTPQRQDSFRLDLVGPTRHLGLTLGWVFRFRSDAVKHTSPPPNHP